MTLNSKELKFSEAQKRVIDHDKGHLRIVACPGSGKTEVVSQRVAELIKKGVPPAEIVAFTFTEKAAEGLKLRIRGILERKCPDKSDFGDMYIGTIDSFCLHLLKELRPEYRSFEVLDSARRIAFVDRWYYRMGFSALERGTMRKWRAMKRFCDGADKTMMERVDVSQITDEVFVECYKKYIEKLEKEKFFDFTSIIFTLLEVLKSDEKAMEQLGKTVRHVVFDEYQDVNMLQEELLEMLSVGSESVCVVGDDDQNIFQWRGSNVDYILDFPEKYKSYGVTTETLDVNYRATSGLVETADSFIRHNTNRVSKNMRAYEKQTREFETGDIMYNHFDVDTEEFQFILEKINSLLGTDFTDKHENTYALSYSDMAVLVSSNEDAARIIRFFEEHDIPCIADSGSSVFDRPLVALATDCISYVFDCPGYTTGNDIPAIEELVGRYGSIFNQNEQNFGKNLKEVKKRAGIVIAKGKADWLPNLGLQEFFQRIISAMGAEEGIFDEVDLYNLAVLSGAISDYEYVYQTLRAREVAGFKWFVAQFAESNYSDPRHNDPTLVNAIRILTIWKAKGLEFPVVFVPTFVKKQKLPPFPGFVDDSLYDRSRYDGDEEDDRRAYYTAITRSQKYLFLSGARRRAIVVGSSPSINEIQPHPFVDQMMNGYFSTSGIISKPKTKNKPMVHSEGTFPTSYSELSIYGRCPYEYKLRHVLGFNAGVPAAFGYGTNIHNILNLIHSNYITQKKIPDEKEIENAFDSMFYMRFAPGEQNDNMKRAGAKVVKNYVDLHKDDFRRILHTEKRFEFVMGKALISGDIDLLKRVNDKGQITEVEIIDFKTDKQREDGKYALDYSEQVRFYAYATRHSLGYRPESALIHHLDTHTKDYVDISDARLKETKARIEEKVEKIVSGNFDARPEKEMCGKCDFRAICSHKGFGVGVNFGPVKSLAKDSSPRSEDDIDIERHAIEDAPPAPSVVSDNTKKRAEKLSAGKITDNGDGSYQVTSGSDPTKSYRVTERRCECRGFRTYHLRHQGSDPTCSHIEAVKIYKRKNNS